MLTLKTRIRKISGRGVKNLRKKGIIPAILYGPEIKNLALELNLKEFLKVFGEAGESSLISLQLENKKFLVLVHDIKYNPLTNTPLHIDFYQPKLTEEIEVAVPIIFEGEAPAAKELGGTLVKEIQEIKIKALPEKLLHEIKVNVGKLKTFEDEILVKDLELPNGVKVLRQENETIAKVLPPEKIEEELEKPIEEKVEEVEKVEKEKKPKEEKEGAEEPAGEKPASAPPTPPKK